MTIQFPPVESTEPRLLTDTHSQPSADPGGTRSFDEKLRNEQARLGLLFSPYNQFSGLFSYPLEQTFNFSEPERAGQKYSTPQENYGSAYSPAPTTQQPNHAASRAALQLFEGLPLRSPQNGWLQELLAKTGWLTPNLAAQPNFFQAFLDGKLQAKLDMQALVDEIAAKVKLVKSQEKTQFTLTLKPAELGEIVLLLTAQAGLLSIQIQASAETRKLIDESKAELERALKKAGVTFETIKIEEVKEHV
ncbi:MAG: flagellar hook-length control protein FliK [Candidatus Margulisiibacteriota bacterium]